MYFSYSSRNAFARRLLLASAAVLAFPCIAPAQTVSQGQLPAVTIDAPKPKPVATRPPPREARANRASWGDGRPRRSRSREQGSRARAVRCWAS